MKNADFRSFLQHELVKRCKRNPSYSLRAFAQSLGVSHALLSMILKKKRSITPALVKKVGYTLGLKPDEIERFLKASVQGSLSTKSSLQFNELTLDAFHVVADWYHDAIMELCRTKDFDPSSRGIAKALGITVSEASIAIERLERLGMIKKDADGKWITNDYTTIMETDFTTGALRVYQRKVLELSAKALETVPKTVRDHTSVTLAVRSTDIPEIKERIKKFRRELTQFIQRSGEPFDDVYQLALSLYPITTFYSHKNKLSRRNQNEIDC